MAIRIQLRRDTAANWVSSNPTLRAGEVGIETDTLKFKIGNGSSTWTQITNYANVTSTGLSNSLNDYILASTLGNPNGPAKLNADGEVLVPEDTIILWNDDEYTYTTKITATQPTANRVITLPNNTGTVALTSDLNSYAALSGATFTGNIQVPTTVTFEGATSDSYETSLVATDPTADRTITLPDRDGTVITTGDTGTVTNTMLAGSIANDKLANSSITINGFPISLGGTASYGTDNIGEGTTNKYFTDERAQDAVAAALAAGTHTNITVNYNDNANSISLAAAPGYTDEEARDAVAGIITSATHNGISVSYTDDNSNPGTLAFTNTDKGSSQNIFKNIVVGATTVVADGNDDTLTFVGSNGVGALANATNDVIEFYNTGVTSLTGTTNEIEVNSSTGSVTVGLPDNVTIAGNLTLSNAPTQDSHAATKAYVDASTAGLNVHASVKAATTANVNLTNQLRNGDVIDGYTLSNGERVLVKNQNSSADNGVYLVGGGAATRATDYDTVGEVDAGDFIFVENGTVNGKTGWIQTNVITTLGTDPIAFTQFSGAGTYSAGTGLTLTGNSFSINTATTVDLNTAQTLTNKTITGTFTGNLTGNVTGNADTATNGVVTTGTYSNPSWITALAWSKISSTPTTIAGYGITDPIVLTSGTYSNPSWITGLAWSKISSTPTTLAGYGITDALSSSTAASTYLTQTNAASTYAPIASPTFTGTVSGITKSMVGLGNVENTALSTWAGSTSITTLGTIATGTWSGTTIATTKGGTGLTSYASGDILYASATDTLAKLAKGTDGQILTLASGVPSWAAAPITLPSQTGNSGKYLTTDGTTASWGTLVVPITTTTTTLSSNTATSIDTTALSGFTSLEYMVSLKQGSKVRTSKVVLQTDGTSVDMTEFAITETGGTMSGVVVSATTSGSNAALQLTVTDASTTNVTVKFSKIIL